MKTTKRQKEGKEIEILPKVDLYVLYIIQQSNAMCKNFDVNRYHSVLLELTFFFISLFIFFISSVRRSICRHIDQLNRPQKIRVYLSQFFHYVKHENIELVQAQVQDCRIP